MSYKVTEGPFLQKAILSWTEQFLSEFACFFVKQNLIKYVPCIINKPNIKVSRGFEDIQLSITSEESKTSRFRCCPGIRSKICLPFKFFPPSPPISVPPFRESGNLDQGSLSVIFAEIVFGQVRSRAILSHPRFPSSTLPGNPLFGLIT